MSSAANWLTGVALHETEELAAVAARCAVGIEKSENWIDHYLLIFRNQSIPFRFDEEFVPLDRVIEQFSRDRAAVSDRLREISLTRAAWQDRLERVYQQKVALLNQKGEHLRRALQAQTLRLRRAREETRKRQTQVETLEKKLDEFRAHRGGIPSVQRAPSLKLHLSTTETTASNTSTPRTEATHIGEWSTERLKAEKQSVKLQLRAWEAQFIDERGVSPRKRDMPTDIKALYKRHGDLRAELDRRVTEEAALASPKKDLDLEAVERKFEEIEHREFIPKAEQNVAANGKENPTKGEEIRLRESAKARAALEARIQEQSQQIEMLRKQHEQEVARIRGDSVRPEETAANPKVETTKTSQSIASEIPQPTEIESFRAEAVQHIQLLEKDIQQLRTKLQDAEQNSLIKEQELASLRRMAQQKAPESEAATGGTSEGHRQVVSELQAAREELQAKETEVSLLKQEIAAVQSAAAERDRALAELQEASTKGEADLMKRQQEMQDQIEALEFKLAEQEQHTMEATAAAQLEQRKSHEDLEAALAELEELKTANEQLLEDAGDAQALREKATRLEEEHSKAIARAEEVDELLRREQLIRKKLRNEIEELKGAIRVYARCRPMNSSERERNDKICVLFPDQFTIGLIRQTNGKQATKQFEFDHVFSEDINGSQDSVFEETRGLAQSACDGFNVCIFAYGQTGSGKTFTMAGTPEEPGLKPRFVRELFKIARRESKTFEYKFSAMLLEIYLNVLGDLFLRSSDPHAEQSKLVPRLDRKGVVQVPGAEIREFDTAEAMLQGVDEAESFRKVGATKMNAESSRSHLLFSIIIEKLDKRDGKIIRGKLTLVDLAGSESVKKTGATKERLKEAMAINKSLSCLGNVINKLSTNAKFVPYRDHVLTQLMQDSLGGSAKTLMFVNLSPSEYNYDESSSSLTYASLVKTITNNSKQDIESKEVTRLKAIIKKLRLGQVVDDDWDPEEERSAAA